MPVEPPIVQTPAPTPRWPAMVSGLGAWNPGANINHMDKTRRDAIVSLLLSGSLAVAQEPLDQNGFPIHHQPGEPDDGDRRMPDGKSQNNAIAKKEHEDALKDAQELVTLAQQIRDEVQKAGNYVVPVSTLKKTEDIEKLARKIRSRLKS